MAVVLVGSTVVALAWYKKSSSTPKRLPAAMIAGTLDGAFISPERIAREPQILSCAAVRTVSVPDEKRPPLDEVLRQAQAALEADRLEEALGRCREAIELDPRSAHAYYLLGVVDLERGAQDEARQALLQSVKLDPSHIGTHVYLGKVYLVSKEWTAAAREFQAATRLGDATGSGEFGQALAVLGESHYQEALPHLLASVNADPKDPERLYTLLATELQLKQVDAARHHLAEIEQLNPDDPWIHARLGQILAKHGMTEAAEAMLDRAASLLAKTAKSPGPPDLKRSDLYLEIARLRYGEHDYRGTLEELNKIEASRLGPQAQAEMYHLQGAALLEEGQAQEARDKLRRAAEMNPSAADYFVHWAWAELLAGDMKAAASAAEIAKREWPQVSNVQLLLAILERERMPERVRVPFSAPWHLKGHGLVCCPCKVPCPCRSNAPPTYGHCENTGAYRITEGHYADIRLDGLTFAAVDALMGEEKIPSSVYVDSSSTDEQVIALERIFQTFNPLHPFLFLNVKRAKVSFVVSQPGRTYEVSVPGVIQIKIQRQLDSKGEPLVRTAALDYFSNTLEYARNLTYKVWDDDGKLRWDFSGRQANFRTVDLDSQAYRDQQMLVQYIDESGFFNRKQLELIKSLKLPTLRSYPKPAR